MFGNRKELLRRTFLGAQSESSSNEKHHESNLVWGPLGMGFSIVLTAISAMRHDLLFLFFVAWACFAFGAWRVSKQIRYKALRNWIAAVTSVVAAFGLWWLSSWL